MGHWETLKTFVSRNLGHCRSVSLSGSTPVSVVLRKSVRLYLELLRNPQKGTLKIKISKTFLKGARLEGARCFGNRSPFNLDPRLVSLCDHPLYYWASGFNNLYET